MSWALVPLLLALAASQAQDVPPDERASSSPRGRDDAFKMVDAYIVSNMQESLELGEEEFVRLLPLVRRLQTDRRDLAQRRFRALREIRRLLESGSATEPRLAELMREVKSAEQEQATLIPRDLDAIDDALTPVQQAKFRVLEQEVEQKIRALMGQVRENRDQRRRDRKDEPRDPTRRDEPRREEPPSN
jgi:hypothetical protein